MAFSVLVRVCPWLIMVWFGWLVSGCAIGTQGVYHQVKRGETVWSIARTYSVPPASILRKNRISDPEHLPVGRRLFIPDATGTRTGSTSGRAGTGSGSGSGRTTTTSRPPARPTAPPPLTLQWPVSGRIISEFGPHGAIINNGIDIAAEAGTPVAAAAAAEVVFSGTVEGLGTVAILDHGQGYVTIYAHLQSVSATLNQRLLPGEVFAAAGHTGRVTTPQLHFEVRYHSDPYNPRLFLK